MLVKLSNVIKEDIKELSKEIEGQLKKLEGSRVLISGGGGFLGGYFLDLIDYCNQNIFETPCSNTPSRSNLILPRYETMEPVFAQMVSVKLISKSLDVSSSKTPSPLSSCCVF